MLEKWSVIREIVMLLQIPYNETIAFQNKKLTLSDVFGRWLGMELHLEACTKKRLRTNLAKYLYEATKNRKQKIFNNPLMSCALFMDPRFHIEILKYPEKVEQAKQNMLTIWRRLHILNSNDTSAQMETTNISSDNSSFGFDEQDALAKHLQRGSEEIHDISMQNNVAAATIDIELIINLYDPGSIPLNSSILSYWENMKDEHRELYQIAMVVFSVPPTEVQIERDFSSLDCVFTKRRGNLCNSRLEDIFIIYLNPDLFNVVTEEEIDELYTSLDVRNLQSN